MTIAEHEAKLRALIREMKSGIRDPEHWHAEADEIVESALRELDQDMLAELYHDIRKWYS